MKTVAERMKDISQRAELGLCSWPEVQIVINQHLTEQDAEAQVALKAAVEAEHNAWTDKENDVKERHEKEKESLIGDACVAVAGLYNHPASKERAVEYMHARLCKKVCIIPHAKPLTPVDAEQYTLTMEENANLRKLVATQNGQHPYGQAWNRSRVDFDHAWEVFRNRIQKDRHYGAHWFLAIQAIVATGIRAYIHGKGSVGSVARERAAVFMQNLFGSQVDQAAVKEATKRQEHYDHLHQDSQDADALIWRTLFDGKGGSSTTFFPDEPVAPDATTAKLKATSDELARIAATLKEPLRTKHKLDEGKSAE